MSISTLPTPGERLYSRVATVAGVLNRAHAELVDLTAELIETQAWAEGGGILSPAHWLMLRAGLSRARAVQIVALAERSAELPATMGALRAGDISADQATPIAKHVPEAFEASVLELARHATVPQITRAASGTDFTPMPSFEENQARWGEEKAAREEAERTGVSPVPPPVPVEPPSLSMHHARGRFHLHYQAPSDIGALVEQAVREATDAIWRQRNGRSPEGTTTPDDETASQTRTRNARGRNTGTPTPAGTKCSTGTTTVPGTPGAAGTAPAAPPAGAGAAGDPPATGGAGAAFVPDGSCHPSGSTATDTTTATAASAAATDPAVAPTSTPAATASAAEITSPATEPSNAAQEVDRVNGAGSVKVTLAEGFAEVATRSLGAVMSTSRRDRYRVYVHLDTRGGWLTGRPRLPQHVTETLTCDGVLQPVWFTEGAPVNVGRSQRIVPERTRRLLDDRDRGCRYPGCLSRGFTEKHHIIHWLDGGASDTPNLLSICPAHHDAHHRGEFAITGNADLPETHPEGVRFLGPGGHRIAYHRPPPVPPDTPLPAGPAYAAPTGERMISHHVVFYPTPATEPS